MEESIDIISKQTGVSDKAVIQETLIELNGDIIKTIMKLSHIDSCPEKCKSAPSEFDDIRRIVDEKENIYFQMKK